MQDLHHSPNYSAKAAAASKDDAQQAQAATEKLYEKPKRTLGLKLFDIGLYPLLSNFAVFAISVVFTFLTERGGDRRLDGSRVYGGVGKFFQARGVWLENQFKKTGMSAKNANMGKIVAFSFIDGSIMAFPIKWLENHRENIAKSIDKTFGTLPEDNTPYDAEPKQSWGSVFGGRAITAGIVVPVAMALSKNFAYRNIRAKSGEPWVGKEPYTTVFGSKELEANTSLNDIMFNDLSERHSQKLPGLKRAFSRMIEKMTGVASHETIHAPVVKDGVTTMHRVNQSDKAYATLARMTYFEAFYTSVCTAGLYISSRILARAFSTKKPATATDTKAIADTQAQPVVTSTEAKEASSEHQKHQPRPHVQAHQAETSRLSTGDLAVGHAHG